MGSVPKLFIMSEQFRGRVFELSKPEMTIGRVDQRDICIKDPTVSTNHCTVFQRDGVFYVRDNGSTNGTRVNGNPVEPGEEVELQGADMLQVGGIELLFESDDNSVTTIMRTRTEIDIDAAGQTQTIQRIDTSAFSRKRNNEASQKVFIIIIILLALLVVGMAAFVLLTVLKGPGGN